MMTVGDLMFVKTTSETVMIMAVETEKDTNQLVATVRRPAGTRENGVVHHTEKFYMYELMTEDESNALNMTRQLNEYKTMMKLQEMTKEPIKAAAVSIN